MTEQEREKLIDDIIDDIMFLIHGESGDNRQESAES